MTCDQILASFVFLSYNVSKECEDCVYE